MQLKEAHWSRLADRNERAEAKLARIARWDTINGGTRALVLAKRMERMGTSIDAKGIVGDVYAASNWSCGEHGAYECPECGQAHLGTEAAWQCCAEPWDGEE